MSQMERGVIISSKNGMYRLPNDLRFKKNGLKI